jgi:hypothetical protein
MQYTVRHPLLNPFLAAASNFNRLQFVTDWLLSLFCLYRLVLKFYLETHALAKLHFGFSTSATMHNGNGPA